MRTTRFILGLEIVALAALHPVGLAQKASPDLILFNGKVFTSNANQLYAEALAIRRERIVAVGSSKEVIALADQNTKRIDLGGRTVIPGINDAHMHLGIAPDTYDLPLKSIDPSWKEITDALGSAVSLHIPISAAGKRCAKRRSGVGPYPVSSKSSYQHYLMQEVSSG